MVALTVALASCLEVAARALAPVPYAPRARDLVLSLLCYGAAAVPACIVAWGGFRWSRLQAAALAGPLGLLVVNLAFSYGTQSKELLCLFALLGVGLGTPAIHRASPRLLGTATAMCLAIVAVAWLLPSHRPASSKPSVLLVMLDTTRADRLSVYGYPRATSPNLAALAQRGVVYRRAISTAPWTVPSHAAIFAGRFPSQVGFDGVTLDGSLGAAGSIAMDLANSGRVTAGVTANPIVSATDGLVVGFGAMWDEWRLTRSMPETVLYRLTDWSQEQTHGDRITALALDWVDRLVSAGQPWLLFLNYMDPHAPYSPPERERQLFSSEEGITSIDDPRAYNAGALPLTAAVRTAISDLYDGELATMDRAVGHLLQQLSRRGYDVDTNLFLIIAGDHGESLGEQGVLGHQLGLPDTVLHVPLLIAGPGVQPAVVDPPVQTVQIRATVRALLGLTDSTTDVAPALPPWGTAPAMLISQHPFPRWYHDELRTWNPHFDSSPWLGDWVAVERDGLKVVFNDRGSGSQYDLRADPHERDPKPVSEGAELVQTYRALPIASMSRRPAVLSEQARSAMRQLGYIQ